MVSTFHEPIVRAHTCVSICTRAQWRYFTSCRSVYKKWNASCKQQEKIVNKLMLHCAVRVFLWQLFEVNFTYRFFIICGAFFSARRLDDNNTKQHKHRISCFFFWFSFIQNKINEALRFVFISPLCHFLISDMLNRDAQHSTYISSHFIAWGCEKSYCIYSFRMKCRFYLVWARVCEGWERGGHFIFWSVKSPDKNYSDNKWDRLRAWCVSRAQFLWLHSYIFVALESGKC